MKPLTRGDLWLPADWPAPAHIHAGTTTRQGGESRAPFNRLNLAGHVGDDKETVTRNRALLRQQLQLPDEPHWLNQTHSNRVVRVRTPASPKVADAAYTNKSNTVCAVLTADCVPILLCNRAGTEIAAIHAGWRGLCANVINNTIACFASGREQLIAWIGPHISPRHYTVHDDVRNPCIDSLSESVAEAFQQTDRDTWHADLGLMARVSLLKAGMAEVYACNLCTYQNREYFYSYRREKKTGRMASLIWIEHTPIR